jgi:hypothetical protein
MASFRCWLPVIGALAWVLPAWADALDLRDPTPRPVEVAFEVSPGEQPGRLDALYGEALPARLVPHERAGQVIVVLPGALVESHLLVRENPRPGSFGDFVWVFDAESGHVLSATLAGVVRRRIELGPLHRTVEAEIEVAMSTARPAGFRAPRWLLGQRVFELCEEPGDAACSFVQPAAYDPATGYINAVGVIVARTRGVAARSFSSLGEARFFEAEDAAAPAIASGPPR